MRRRTGWNQYRPTGADRIISFVFWFWVAVLAVAAGILIALQMRGR